MKTMVHFLEIKAKVFHSCKNTLRKHLFLTVDQCLLNMLFLGGTFFFFNDEIVALLITLHQCGQTLSSHSLLSNFSNDRFPITNSNYKYTICYISMVINGVLRNRFTHAEISLIFLFLHNEYKTFISQKEDVFTFVQQFLKRTYKTSWYIRIA